MKIRQSIFGLVAFAAIMVVAGVAYASCWGDNRVHFTDAQCLHAWWDNNDWPRKNKFGVQGSCKDWGTVVAKISLQSCTDRTWHLNNDNKRRGESICRVLGIFCCKDVGDLCNWSDATTVEGCTSQWNKSPASDTCDFDTTGTADGVTFQWPSAVSTSGNDCTFYAKCDYAADDGTTQENQTSIENVFWPDADEVQNCDGELKEGSYSC